MAAEVRTVLVVGPAGSGKTCLLRRFVDGACPASSRPTLGIDMKAGLWRLSSDMPELYPELAALLPAGGLELYLWDVGGREHREAPRGQRIDGLLLCYDATSRTSFHLAPHLLCSYRMDKHTEHSLRSESMVKKGTVQKRLPCVLCGNKTDQDSVVEVQDCEVQECVSANSMQDAVQTCARTGVGVLDAFQRLLLAVLRGEQDFEVERLEAAASLGTPAAAAWSLPCSADRGVPAEHQSSGVLGAMTGPRGMRPREPERGSRDAPTRASRLVEVLGHGTAIPRTVQQCLEQGLQHRAVHVWLICPRTGAVLLRKWSHNALKNPGLWGPTCHGEVHCYGDSGDGHASELSEQAAVRLVGEQLGIRAADLGELEHWFSTLSTDGKCLELVDVQVARVGAGNGTPGGEALPPLHLRKTEEVNWVFFGEVFNQKARDIGMICHMEEEYRSSMIRRMRACTVREEVLMAFGDGVDLSVL